MLAVETSCQRCPDGEWPNQGHLAAGIQGRIIGTREVLLLLELTGAMVRGGGCRVGPLLPV